MSTVPEAMLARAMGMRVAGLSCISNLAAGTGGQALSHADVMAQARLAQPAMAELLLRACTVIVGQS
jgi:purine-nucleoside phosphorylase